MYHLSEAAQRLDLHPNTLIQYEQLGLVEPKRNPQNDYRIYDEADLTWIRCLREMIHDAGYDRKTLSRMLDLNDCWEVRECSPAEVERCRWARKVKDSQ